MISKNWKTLVTLVISEKECTSLDMEKQVLNLLYKAGVNGDKGWLQRHENHDLSGFRAGPRGEAARRSRSLCVQTARHERVCANCNKHDFTTRNSIDKMKDSRKSCSSETCSHDSGLHLSFLQMFLQHIKTL